MYAVGEPVNPTKKRGYTQVKYAFAVEDSPQDFWMKNKMEKVEKDNYVQYRRSDLNGHQFEAVDISDSNVMVAVFVATPYGAPIPCSWVSKKVEIRKVPTGAMGNSNSGEFKPATNLYTDSGEFKPATNLCTDSEV